MRTERGQCLNPISTESRSHEGVPKASLVEYCLNKLNWEIQMFEIDKDITPQAYMQPIQPSTEYPWNKMANGDSILVRCRHAAANKQRNKALADAHRTGWRISTKWVGDGLRIWMLGPRGSV